MPGNCFALPAVVLLCVFVTLRMFADITFLPCSALLHRLSGFSVSEYSHPIMSLPAPSINSRFPRAAAAKTKFPSILSIRSEASTAYPGRWMHTDFPPHWRRCWSRFSRSAWKEQTLSFLPAAICITRLSGPQTQSFYLATDVLSANQHLIINNEFQGP